MLAGAVDLALKVEHETESVGSDGVTRTTRFAERLVRRDGESWVERILPPHAHDEDEHRTGARGHKHMDVSAAARWVTRAADGKLAVRVVSRHEKVMVDVAPVDYPNIGFDGRWTTASQLMDPEQLSRMKPSSRSAPAGARWYETSTPAMKLQVLWDEKEQYPRRLESASLRGTGRASTVATREAMPVTPPWQSLQGYARKDYSDLLD